MRHGKSISFKCYIECCERIYSLSSTGIGVNYGGPKGGALSGLTEGGEICLTPSVFWQVIPTWQQEIRNYELR